MAFTMITKHNREGFEVMSAMQKAIRRGLEREALSYALELSQTGKSFGTMVWNRLCVIAHEDVGLLNFDALLLTQVCAGYYKDRYGKDGHDLALANCVLLLCRGRKTREACNFLIAVHNSPPMPILDCALDMHTRRGREKGRGLSHFFADGATLDPPDDTDKYREETMNLLLHGKAKAKEPEPDIEVKAESRGTLFEV